MCCEIGVEVWNLLQVCIISTVSGTILKRTAIHSANENGMNILIKKDLYLSIIHNVTFTKNEYSIST